MKSALPRNERGDGEVLVQPMIVSHGGSRSLYSNRSGNILSGGDMQTPHQTLAIQALRNTRWSRRLRMDGVLHLVSPDRPIGRHSVLPMAATSASEQARDQVLLRVDSITKQ